MSKRIVIVGAGAVGAYVGGYFARHGHDVTFFDPWPAHVEAMREHGLSLSGLTEGECFHTPVKALHLTEVQSLVRAAPIDIAFVCVKSYDTAWATMLIKDYLAPTGFVVSLQNCINEETIAGIVGWGKTVGCIASKISVELTGPATVRRGVPLGGNAHTVFRIGEVHGRISPRIEEIAAMLSQIDSTKTTTNLWGERWSKLSTNAMRNPISAASGMSSNGCDTEPVTRKLSIRVGGEAVKVGRALGYDLEKILKFDPADWASAADGDSAKMAMIEQGLQDAMQGRSEAQRPSMGQDIQKGRRTEIDFINGHIVRKAEEVGIPVPANAGLVDAVRRIERGQAAPGLAMVADI